MIAVMRSAKLTLPCLVFATNVLSKLNGLIEPLSERSADNDDDDGDDDEDEETVLVTGEMPAHDCRKRRAESMIVKDFEEDHGGEVRLMLPYE